MMSLLAVGVCVRQLLLEIAFQGYSIVVLGVMGAIEQRNRTAFGGFQIGSQASGRVSSSAKYLRWNSVHFSGS